MTPGQWMLIAWPFVVLILFRTLSGHRALIASLLVGWLALPPAWLEVAGITLGKNDLQRLPLLLGALLFQRRALLSFRPRWFDLPIVLFCLSPLVSGLVNGLGLRFALIQHYKECVFWLLPYLLARALIRSPSQFREFGIAMAAGALLYAPLCLFEVKYGLHFSEWLAGGTTARQGRGAGREGGTYRAVVLLRDGFVLTMMQGFGALLLFWLWFSRVKRKWGPIPLVLFAIAPLAVVILSKSFGSIILTFAGLLVLLASHFTRLRIWLAIPVLLVPTYMGLRLTGAVPTETLVAPIRKFAPHKVKTFEFRLKVEDAVARAVRKQPVFGYGHFGLWRSGKKPHIDGFWLMTVSRTGVPSLFLWVALSLLPVAMFLWRTPTRRWATPEEGTAAVVAVFLTLVAIDALQNNYVAAPFLAMLAGLASHVDARKGGAAGGVPGEEEEPGG